VSSSPAPVGEKLGGRTLNRSRFGTIAGVMAGLTAGIGISIAHSAFSASKPAPARVVSGTAMPALSNSAVDSVSFAQAVAAQMKAHRQAIARHEREPRNPVWASPTEQLFKDGLAKLASQGKFQVTSVDCRTTSCVAYVRVASYLDARKAWPLVLNARTDTECGTEVTLDQPQPGDSAFDFSVVYDCSKTPQLEAQRK